MSSASSISRSPDGTAGRTAFVIKFGILGWGIPCAFLTTAWDWYCGLPSSDLAASLAIRLVLFGLVGGIAFGAAMWKMSQRTKSHVAAAASKRV